MQYTKEKLRAQQLCLFHLGFYTGLLDGIWGPGCIEAKRKFESDPSFVPGNPNGGLPFGERDRLPRGMIYDSSNHIQHTGLTDERRAEIETALQKRAEAAQPKRAETKDVQQADEQPHVTAHSEEPVTDAGSEVEEGKADLAAGSANPNEPQKAQHNQQRHQHHQKHKR